MLVDWSRIETLIDGDDPSDLDWIQEMIQTLYENMEKRVDNIEEFSNQKDGEKLRSELHQIKGVSANFGLTDLYNLVVDAESKIKESNLEEAIILSRKVSDTWKNTKKELETKYP